MKADSGGIVGSGLEGVMWKIGKKKKYEGWQVLMLLVQSEHSGDGLCSFMI